MLDLFQSKCYNIYYYCDLFTNNPNVIVIPIHGRSTDVFRTILDRFPILNIIHLAGHTDTKTNGEVFLSFVDSNMTFKKFSNWISNRRFRCSFLNCCSIAEFVSDLDSLYSDCSILHSGRVASTVAYGFAEHFYTVISSDGDCNLAWEVAIENCTEEPLKCICC